MPTKIALERQRLVLLIEAQLKSHQTNEVVWEWGEKTKPKESSKLGMRIILGLNGVCLASILYCPGKICDL